MKIRPIVISTTDHRRLSELIEAARRDFPAGDKYLEALAAELARARVVPASRVPAGVITMNSVARLYDLELEEAEEYALVYPEDADVSVNRISVLAPVGTAILGYRVGDVVEWRVPAGLRRLRVDEVFQQDERPVALQD